MSVSQNFKAVQLLEGKLLPSDKAKIAATAGVSKTTITRFFKGTMGPDYKKILLEVIKTAKANAEMEQLLNQEIEPKLDQHG